MTDYGSIETFRNLDVSAPYQVLSGLGDALENVLPAASWARDKAREAELAASALQKDLTFVFNRRGDDKSPEASLFLMVSGNTASVGNVVPRKIGQLTKAQYNGVIADFFSAGIDPLTGKLGLKVNSTGAMRPLTDLLTEAAAKKLKVFSDAANKSSGSSHPADYKRWLDFIVQAHRDGCALDSSYLGRWLHEVEHWSEDQAHDLAAEYSFGRDLLNRVERP